MVFEDNYLDLLIMSYVSCIVKIATAISLVQSISQLFPPVEEDVFSPEAVALIQNYGIF